ncbi:MAG: adenylosuccinate synthetase, partial [Kiritimatiellae bacterium]|nr:adenylosuccinate synthetase [Kiritimatiellia bacterium]
GTITHPFTPEATGRLIYAANGLMSAFLMMPDWGVAAERAGTRGLTAYSARWEVLGDIVHHAVDFASDPRMLGETLRRRGGEFGATTGRPRRCGWFDAVVARYAQRVNGVDFWAMTKLDVLDEFPVVRICTGYRRADGFVYTTFPADLDALASCEPVYEDLPGWQCSTSSVTDYSELPENAKAYVNRILELIGGRLGVLSVGPARETTLRVGI